MAHAELRNNPPIDRPRVTWPSAGQIVRQLIIAAVVVAIWAVGLVAYLRLTGGPDKVAFVPIPPTSTSAPVPTPTPSLPPDLVTETPDAGSGSVETPLVVVDITSELASPAPVVEVEPSAGASSGPSFVADVMPFFNKYCIRCHGDRNPRVGLSLASHPAVLAGSRNGPVLKPGDAAASELARVVIAGEMPPRGEKPTQAEIQILVDWINSGAPDN